MYRAATRQSLLAKVNNAVWTVLEANSVGGGEGDCPCGGSWRRAKGIVKEGSTLFNWNPNSVF